MSALDCGAVTHTLTTTTLTKTRTAYSMINIVKLTYRRVKQTLADSGVRCLYCLAVDVRNKLLYGPPVTKPLSTHRRDTWEHTVQIPSGVNKRRAESSEPSCLCCHTGCTPEWTLSRRSTHYGIFVWVVPRWTNRDVQTCLSKKDLSSAVLGWFNYTNTFLLLRPHHSWHLDQSYPITNYS